MTCLCFLPLKPGQVVYLGAEEGSLDICPVQPVSTEYYSRSDSSLAITFATFLRQNIQIAIQTWQPSLEHYYVFVQTYFLSQLRKMLILLISSFCKMCTLPTLQSRMFVCCKQYKHARSYCWQWTHFTMVPNEQNQHFAEMRQKIC